MHCTKISQEQTFKGHEGSLWIKPDYMGMQTWTLLPDYLPAFLFFNTGDVVMCVQKEKQVLWKQFQWCFFGGQPILSTAWHSTSFLREMHTLQWGILLSKEARSTELCCRQCSSLPLLNKSAQGLLDRVTPQLLQQCSCWCTVPREAAGNEEPPEHQQARKMLTTGSHISHFLIPQHIAEDVCVGSLWQNYCTTAERRISFPVSKLSRHFLGLFLG